jgi:hypothetical protein
MTPDERRLHRYLGYRPLATPRAARGGPSVLPPDEVPPLDRQGIDALTLAFEENPDGVLARAQALWDAALTHDDLREAIVQAQAALRAPRETINAHKAAEAQWASAHTLPANFTFPLMTPDIEIQPASRKFETVADADGWVIFAGPYLIGSIFTTPAPFRWHSDPQYANKFVYSLPEPSPDEPLKIALLSDFGTGLYHSLYIARQLEHRKYPYAVHLGDVYYAGRRSEFVHHFESPLRRILPDTKLFTLNANHEMYSGGLPYFDYISTRKQAHAHQEQEGSYFALRSRQFQLVGIDTAYFGHGRYAQPDLLEWLEWVLVEGRNRDLMNILLSSDEPYDYGKADATKLYTEDLGRFAQRELIDLWLWGNTHYCALFDRNVTYPFVGSCIGHGGYPYSRYQRGRTEPAPLLFLETQARFPAWTNVRPDRGNNGYCELELGADGAVTLRYIDWMGNPRCIASLSALRSGNTPTITVQPCV